MHAKLERSLEREFSVATISITCRRILNQEIENNMTTKLDIRETLEIPVLEASNAEEYFQNQTLRPILKLQNDIYLLLFSTYALRQNKDFASLSASKKRLFVEQSLQKDGVLKNTFIGITIGMFTAEELETYILDSKGYNKRIAAMVIERIRSQMK